MRILHVEAEGAPVTRLDPEIIFSGWAGWIWLDVSINEEALIQRLATRFNWDRIEMEDVFDDSPIGKVIDVGEHVFVVMQTLGKAPRRVSTVEVDAFLMEDLLVTIRHGEIDVIDDLYEASATATSGGADRMLARLAAGLVAPLLPLLDSLEERIETLEDRAIARDPSVIGEVQVLRSDVTRLRRFVAPQRDVALSLSREDATPLITRRARQRFSDVHEQLYRVVESLDGARLLLASVLETYRSTVAEDMNRVMKVLTVFSAIMLPLTLMAGIWGMNFRQMPELEKPNGYFIALGSMAGFGVALWTWFSRQGFIGGPRLRDLPKAIGLGLWEVATLPVKGVGKVVRSVFDESEVDGRSIGGE